MPRKQKEWCKGCGSTNVTEVVTETEVLVSGSGFGPVKAPGDDVIRRNCGDCGRSDLLIDYDSKQRKAREAKKKARAEKRTK